jgi:hypothetical protein
MITPRTLLVAAAAALAGCAVGPAPVAAPAPVSRPVVQAPPAPAPTSGGTSFHVDSEPAPGQPRSLRAAGPTGSGPDQPTIIAETKRLRDRARSCITVAGELRTGRVKITIAPSGHANEVVLTGHLGKSAESGCVTTAFRDFHVAPFAGEPVTVKMSISLP